MRPVSSANVRTRPSESRAGHAEARRRPPLALTIVRARMVVPVSMPPLADGAVAIARGRVRAVGRYSELRRHTHARVVDLGDVAVLPGLVNAHCHLDYTDMAGQLVPPRSFTDWIKSITELKTGWSRDDFLRSWLHGARMLVETGTTTVGDVECAPDLLPDLWSATPLRVVSFLEMTGVRSRRQPRTILEETLKHIAALPRGRHRAWLSPHAPYSTTPELLRRCGAVVRQRGWRLTIHVAESAEEFAMFTRRRGPMYAWLARNERDMSDCGRVSPVQHLARQRLLGSQILAIHANYLGRGDADLLAEHGTHVVHCPRSHTYFDHRPFPFTALQRRRVNVCLGTDSLATVVTRRHEPVRLDLFADMSAFASTHPKVSPAQILRLATVNGARALGFAGRAGELSAGSWADLIAVPYSGGLRDVCAAVVHEDHPRPAVMIDGAWVAGNPVAPTPRQPA